MSSLGEEFPKQQARLRELLKTYQSLGAVGKFGATVIENCLQRADKAAMEQDIYKMMSIYKEMENFE